MRRPKANFNHYSYDRESNFFFFYISVSFLQGKMRKKIIFPVEPSAVSMCFRRGILYDFRALDTTLFFSMPPYLDLGFYE